MAVLKKNPRDLIVYKKTLKFIKNIEIKSKHFEDENLKSQLNRSALSVLSNIAEGNPQESLKNKLKFYNIAFCSLRESQSQLDVALIIDAISESDYNKIYKDAEEIARLLYGLIRKETNKSGKAEI